MVLKISVESNRMIKFDLNAINWCKLTRSVIFDTKYSRKLYYRYAQICLLLCYTLITLDILMPCKVSTNDFLYFLKDKHSKLMAAHQTVFSKYKNRSHTHNYGLCVNDVTCVYWGRAYLNPSLVLKKNGLDQAHFSIFKECK